MSAWYGDRGWQTKVRGGSAPSGDDGTSGSSEITVQCESGQVSMPERHEGGASVGSGDVYRWRKEIA